MAITDTYIEDELTARLMAVRGVTPSIGLRKMIGNVRSGTARQKLYIASDSTGRAGSVNWVDDLALKLAARGIPVRSDFYVAAIAYPNVSIGAGWGGSSGGMVNSTTTNPIAGVAKKPFNTLVLKYRDLAAGVHAVQIGSDTPVQTTCTGNNTLKTVTITGTAGSTAFNIARVSGGTIDIIHWECFDSAVNDLQIMNASIGGSGLYNWVSTDINDNGPMISSWAPHAVLFALGINDCNNNTLLATFLTNLNTFATRVGVFGGAINWIAQHPINSPPQPQQPFIDGIKAKALSRNEQFLSMYERFGSSWSAANAALFMGDNLHQNGIGSADIASAVLQMFPD